MTEKTAAKAVQDNVFNFKPVDDDDLSVRLSREANGVPAAARAEEKPVGGVSSPVEESAGKSFTTPVTTEMPVGQKPTDGKRVTTDDKGVGLLGLV